MKRKFLLLMLALLCGCALAGCKGKALPEGMEEEKVLAAGQEIVDLLVAGDCQSVYDRLRPDVRYGCLLVRNAGSPCSDLHIPQDRSRHDRSY